MGLIISFKNNQTQNGLNAIYIKKNKVASAAIKCLVANTKQQFTKPDRTPPNKKQRKKSWVDICKEPTFWNEVNPMAIMPDINKQGSISIFLLDLIIIV